MSSRRLGPQVVHALGRLLHQSAGLSFDGSRRDALVHAVGRRMDALGVADGADYLRLVTGDDAAVERQALLNEATVHETSFFRNPPQVRALRRHVLPQLVEQARAAGRRRLTAWSAGCSTGEEAYTLAMLLHEAAQPAGLSVEVVATDVSTRALAAARSARYGPRSVALVEPEDLDRWWRRTGEDGTLEVVDEVRHLVRFAHHNLVRDALPLPPGGVDLVLCRNVTIYFTRDTTRALMRTLHEVLRDGGYLLLGHAETLWRVSEAFHLVNLGDAFVYRRLDAGSGERRQVLPDRRTLDEGPPPDVAGRRVGARRSWQRQAGEAVAAGRPDEADRLAAQAADLDPLDARAHLWRGIALTAAGRTAEAADSLRRSVFLDPDEGWAQLLLAVVHERVGQGRAAAAGYAAARSALAGRPGAAQLLDDAPAGDLGRLSREIAGRLGTPDARPVRAPAPAARRGTGRLAGTGARECRPASTPGERRQT